MSPTSREEISAHGGYFLPPPNSELRELHVGDDVLQWVARKDASRFGSGRGAPTIGGIKPRM